MEVQAFLLDILWRPLVIQLPDIRACLKDKSFRQIQFAFPFQMMHEEGKQNIFLKIFPCTRGINEDVSEAFRALPSPASVIPWAHDQVVLNTRIVLFDRCVGFQRAIQVFGIKPSTHC